jgi:hypothetical protein
MYDLMPLHHEINSLNPDAEQASYLILQVGVPTQARIISLESTDGHPRVRQERSSHIRRVNNLLEGLDVTVTGLNVSSGANCFPRYLLSFGHHVRRDEEALRLVEAFAYGLSIAGAPMFQTDDPLIFRVPMGIASRRAVAIKTLLKIETSRSPDDRSLPFPRPGVLSDYSVAATGAHEQGWTIAATTFSNNGLFEATRFLQRSIECFFVYPGGIDEVTYDDVCPHSASIRSRFEDALHNSFKAVEAIIGDPPKDNRRLSEKLKKIGINFDEPVGYRVKEPIGTVIRSMSAARDTKSAHGSTRHRSITPAELLEFQACAHLVVVAALEFQGVDFGSE